MDNGCWACKELNEGSGKKPTKDHVIPKSTNSLLKNSKICLMCSNGKKTEIGINSLTSTCLCKKHNNTITNESMLDKFICAVHKLMSEVKRFYKFGIKEVPLDKKGLEKTLMKCVGSLTTVDNLGGTGYSISEKGSLKFPLQDMARFVWDETVMSEYMGLYLAGNVGDKVYVKKGYTFGIGFPAVNEQTRCVIGIGLEVSSTLPLYLHLSTQQPPPPNYVSARELKFDNSKSCITLK